MAHEEVELATWMVKMLALMCVIAILYTKLSLIS